MHSGLVLMTMAFGNFGFGVGSRFGRSGEEEREE